MVLNFAICKMLMFFQRWCLDFPNWLFFLSSSTWGLFILEYFHKLQFVPNFVFVTQMSPDLIVNTQTFSLGDYIVIRNSERWNFTPITVPKKHNTRLALDFCFSNIDLYYSCYRVDGMMMNSRDFNQAFGCPLGSRMNPQQKCTVWT